MTALQRLLRYLFPPPVTRRRLSDALPILRAEIDTFRMKAGEKLAEKPWLKIADDQYVALGLAIEKREVQQGWKIYKNINRLLVYSLAEQPGKPHISRARAIYHEAADKMPVHSWRQKSIIELLGTPDPGTPGVWVFNAEATTENIIKANEILDEYQDNFYEKLITLNRRIRLLSWTAIVAILVFIGIGPKIGHFPYNSEIPAEVVAEMRKVLQEARDLDSLQIRDSSADAGQTTGATTNGDTTSGTAPVDTDSTGPTPQSAAQSSVPSATSTGMSQKGDSAKADVKAETDLPINKRPRCMAVLVILMGIIGAVASGFLRVIQIESDASTVHQLFGNTILSARLVFATVAALAVYVFLGTGIILFFSPKISFELLLAFSFVAGFSEQLVKKGVETLTKEKLYKGQNPNPDQG